MSEENQVVTGDAAEQVLAAGQPKKRRLSQTLPTDRISFLKQQSIIGAYAVAFEKNGKKSFSNDEVGSLVNMAGSTVSQANSFFAELGLIQKAEAGKYVASDLLMEYDRTKHFSAERAWLKLAPLFKGAWFGQELLPRLRLRPLPEEEAVHFLADAATAEAVHMDQLKMIIEYLCLVGLVQRDGGILRLGGQAVNGEAPSVPTTQAPPAADTPPPQSLPPAPGTETYTLTLDPKAGRKITVQAPPIVTKKELDRIQAWLAVQLIVEEPQPQS